MFNREMEEWEESQVGLGEMEKGEGGIFFYTRTQDTKE
jgi:hypothetical protein